MARKRRAPIQKAIEDFLSKHRHEDGRTLKEWFFDDSDELFKTVTIDGGKAFDKISIDNPFGRVRVIQFPRDNVRNCDPLITFNESWRPIEYEQSCLGVYQCVPEDKVERGYYLRGATGVANMIADRINYFGRLDDVKVSAEAC